MMHHVAIFQGWKIHITIMTGFNHIIKIGRKEVPSTYVIPESDKISTQTQYMGTRKDRDVLTTLPTVTLFFDYCYFSILHLSCLEWPYLHDFLFPSAIWKLCLLPPFPSVLLLICAVLLYLKLSTNLLLIISDTQFELSSVPMGIQLHEIVNKPPFLFQAQSLDIKLMRSPGIFNGIMDFLLHISPHNIIRQISQRNVALIRLMK